MQLVFVLRVSRLVVIREVIIAVFKMWFVLGFFFGDGMRNIRRWLSTPLILLPLLFCVFVSFLEAWFWLCFFKDCAHSGLEARILSPGLGPFVRLTILFVCIVYVLIGFLWQTDWRGIRIPSDFVWALRIIICDLSCSSCMISFVLGTPILVPFRSLVTFTNSISISCSCSAELIFLRSLKIIVVILHNADQLFVDLIDLIVLHRRWRGLLLIIILVGVKVSSIHIE